MTVLLQKWHQFKALDLSPFVLSFHLFLFPYSIMSNEVAPALLQHPVEGQGWRMGCCAGSMGSGDVGQQDTRAGGQRAKLGDALQWWAGCYCDLGEGVFMRNITSRAVWDRVLPPTSFNLFLLWVPFVASHCACPCSPLSHPWPPCSQLCAMHKVPLFCSWVANPRTLHWFITSYQGTHAGAIQCKNPKTSCSPRTALLPGICGQCSVGLEQEHRCAGSQARSPSPSSPCSSTFTNVHLWLSFFPSFLGAMTDRLIYV